MLDWIFEGIVTWISSIVSQLMDAVSGLFLNALGTNMTAMEEYFPFVSKAFTVMQYMAWALLFLITVWQLFRVFGGPNRSREPFVIACKKLFVCVVDRICKTNIPADARLCKSSLYGAHGYYDVFRRFHICRSGTGTD